MHVALICSNNREHPQQIEGNWPRQKQDTFHEDWDKDKFKQ